jgi:hypothetical protein
MMMPTALALVGLELVILSWLVVEEEIVVEPMILGKTISRRRSGSTQALPPKRGQHQSIDLPTVLPPLPGKVEHKTDG